LLLLLLNKQLLLGLELICSGRGHRHNVVIELLLEIIDFLCSFGTLVDEVIKGCPGFMYLVVTSLELVLGIEEPRFQRFEEV